MRGGAALTSLYYCLNVRSTEEESEQDQAAVRSEAAAGAPSETALPDAPPSVPAPQSTTAQGNNPLLTHHKLELIVLPLACCHGLAYAVITLLALCRQHISLSLLQILFCQASTGSIGVLGD